MSMTENELIEALREAQREAKNPEGYLTVIEMSRILGKSDKHVYKLLKPLHEKELLDVKWLAGTSISGVAIKKPGYKLI